jgi:riboflavin synthase
MFTGIVEEVGTLRRITVVERGARLEVAAGEILEGARPGDSIAVNGVCLTVVDKGAGWFASDVSAETLQRTSLKQVSVGTRVNLELPVTPVSRLGGHIVQGHVDGTGELVEIQPSGEGYTVRIGFPPELGRYIVEKGSIAVDGISLTIAALGDEWFEIAIIPHTWRATNLSTLELGASVNLEVDLIAKYVERLIKGRDDFGF